MFAASGKHAIPRLGGWQRSARRGVIYTAKLLTKILRTKIL